MNIEDVKEYVKKYHFLWIGQNATTGEPNQQTGELSYYGGFIAFASKESRDEYYNNWRRVNPSERCIKCTANTGRQFKLGLSVHNYWFYLLSVVSADRP